MKLAETNPNKYPSRMGQPWDADEIVKLLQSVRKSETHAQMAINHGRTVGGIISKLKGLAVDYYDEERPIEQIQKFTGLTKEEIADAVSRRDWKLQQQEKKKEQKQKTYRIEEQNTIHDFVQERDPQLEEMIGLLKDIKQLMTEFVKLVKNKD